MITLTIEKQDAVKANKTRSFSAALLGYIQADLLWDGGAANTKNIRPVYLAVAGTETSLRPFLANLKRGSRAEIKNDKDNRWSRYSNHIECLRSADYEVITLRTEGKEVIITLFLPELFNLDPGMIDPDVCQFLSIPPTWWCKEQLANIMSDQPLVSRLLAHARALGLMSTEGGKDRPIPVPYAYTTEQVLELIPHAGHFALCLDRRTRRPLINDLSFSLQVYMAALDCGLATIPENVGHSYTWGKHKWGGSFRCINTYRLGFDAGVVFRTQHDILDQFLANQVRIYQGVIHVAP